jgi:integrase
MEDGMAKDDQLSARKVATLKEPGYHLDGRGLYLQVTYGKDGKLKKSWVLRYRFSGRVREMGIGPLKDWPLAEAREEARNHRRDVRRGLDPIEARKTKRAEEAALAAKRITFKEATERYVPVRAKTLTNAKCRAQWASPLKTYAFPVMGTLPVDSIALSHVLRVLEPIWDKKPDMASKLRGKIEAVLSWATVRGYRSGDNPARWKGYLSEVLATKPKGKKHASLPFEQIPEFMPWLRNRDGIAALALEFLILTGVRDSNVRKAVWSEIDVDARVWAVPGESTEVDGQRMKMGKHHRVPLTDRAVEILNALPRIKGEQHVFPGRGKGGTLSENTLNKLAQSSGRVDPKQDHRPITAHGFRSTFRTWAAERTTYHRDVLERCLAHDIKTDVEAAYERGDAAP